MVSLELIDIIIIIGFFLVVTLIGFLVSGKQRKSDEDYLLSGRKVGLFLLVTTTVSTWYGGILGVGEFSYSYGLVSWFTQGLPYYIFAIIFAFFFAKKVRNASLFTIPQKLELTYGRKVGIGSAIIIFFLVSPAPYLLMVGSLFSFIFDIHFGYGMLVGLIISSLYLVKGGFKADLWTDVFQFFVMFIGFIIILVVAFTSFGGMNYLQNNLPENHLDFTGGFSPVYLTVWFLIALWTFSDPGFHQRCYSAKSSKIAKWGILISVIIWAFFDFLTTSTGLFSRAILGVIDTPVLAFPLLAEEILSPGLKGLFYAALFATIFSTLNSFLFLGATTFSKDFAEKYFSKSITAVNYTQLGIFVAGSIALIIALVIPSVIEIWYTIGSIFIPSLIFLIIGSYYDRFIISEKYAVWEIGAAILAGLSWMLLKENNIIAQSLNEIEPMIVGLIIAGIIHFIGMIDRGRNLSAS